MKIGIESYYGDKSLFNDKNYLPEDIKLMLKNVNMLCEKQEHIPEKIAKMYGFKIKDYNPEDKYDYYIDLDINKIFIQY